MLVKEEDGYLPAQSHLRRRQISSHGNPLQISLVATGKLNCSFMVCGVKTTLFRVIGGLDKADASSYYCFNKVIDSAGIDYGTSG